ncbi:hypothetical protein COCON_G00145420 [Conger conger]|uniref:SAM pointed domain-containing Ets transcription factor n=1 Tax=Conger conger TaxID=82655 RepID=A0A9Q1HWC1_CONCO|nr:SAM pointed domain-containing Ets transcription factor isoform X1 [Conger conger]KAJ8265443.1 hypothetical protein COCON_G00145420 [Conger conger]
MTKLPPLHLCPTASECPSPLPSSQHQLPAPMSAVVTMGSPDRGEVASSLHSPRVGFAETPLTSLERDAWELEDTKPPRDLAGATERGLPGLYLSCFDMLVTEDATWLLKVSETAPPSSSPRPEQCPVIDSQGLGLSLGLDGQMEERSLEQVQSMVVGEVLKDIETACKLLNITPDPMDWNVGNVQKWMLWTEHLYRLPQVGKAFQDLNGKDLCAMSEEEFRQRNIQCGDVVYAHLDIWKSAAWMKERCSPGDSKFSGGEELWSEADSFCSGQPIHLWQFLRELLLKPHSYGRCIRWLNKEKGIFKIEDSAHVARLWGIRKNRPAMNYDKLSRSIRQYYKKGIIRKPDVSQRLVYQFVHPV